MTISDPGHVRAQYADETRLETRRAVWHPGPDGRDPLGVTMAAVRAGIPADKAMPDVLEVGCGPGVFAARMVAELPGVALLATDSSPRFVELAAERGVTARLMDVEHLLAPDAAYDVVVAMWMLYHVPDLDRGLAELRRVLRPGGRLVAVTNGDEHVADLVREAGGAPVPTSFSSESGQAALARHFSSVSRDDLSPRAVFAAREEALGYLGSFGDDVDWSLPETGWPREYVGHVSVFVAE